MRPGEKIPSDGVVVEGESFVNEALLTGESKPINKKLKDKVVGGAVNGEGILKVQIERTGEETYLAQVIKLVKQAQESKSRIQDLANKAAALLFYVALTAGILAFIAWLFMAGSDVALEGSVTVLVIVCPHALGLAIPLVVALSTSITAKSGILIRDRHAFEMVKDVEAVVFDKTGTLTVGKFGVSDVVAFIPEKELLRLTAAVELNSEHAIAKAIVEHAKNKNVNIPQAKKFKALPGKGAYGKVGKRMIYVGSINLLEELKIKVEDQKIRELQEQGKTVVFTVVNGKLAGAFALADTIGAESYEAIKKLKENGLKVYMLTGDSEEVARWVAKELGVDNYFARVLPDQKAEKIKLLRAAGYNVITIPVAAGVLSGLGVNLPAVVGAMIMSLSTVIVAFNSQTLRKYEPEGVKMVEKKRLVTDPVCGMKIDLGTAYSKIEHKGRLVHFCSKACEEEFKKNPKKYVK